MIKALGDRIAEALAEMIHKKVRDIWGYGLERKSYQMKTMITEKYRGYKACSRISFMPRPYGKRNTLETA